MCIRDRLKTVAKLQNISQVSKLLLKKLNRGYEKNSYPLFFTFRIYISCMYYTPGVGGTAAPFFFPLIAKNTIAPIIISNRGIAISGR